MTKIVMAYWQPQSQRIDMLNEITSLWDYFNKAKQNKKYEKILISAYRYNHGRTTSFEEARKWIDCWVAGNVNPNFRPTCESMVRFLNRFIKQHNEASARMKARRNATPPAVEGAVPPAGIGEGLPVVELQV